MWDRLLESGFRGLRRRHRHDRLHLCSRSPARGHGKKGDGDDGGMGRSRGGFTSKIHALVDAEGRPVNLRLTGGQIADCKSMRSRKISAKVTSCGPTGAITVVPPGPRRPSEGPGPISRRRPTARQASRSQAGSTGNETSWSGSSTTSSNSEALPPATTCARTTTLPPSNSSRRGYGVRVYE